MRDEGEPTSTQVGTGPIKRLGLAIEARVLQYALLFDQMVHVVTRLDPYVEPMTSQELPRDRSGALTYLRRFHVGSRPCSLTYSALRPNELLAPLLVSRAWHTIGSELGRFMAGIGPKIALLSRIEIFWIGSQLLTYPINEL
ncbi:uncharacterized protein HRG_07685 [Hirsutella rhossiliensis]|uniref:Uncharacterized protein n=1 Tax=Hirsutella rhossiliensis TaxID=111463 RepID=A0A9P8MUG5_9HYPO|nr:uncharacterized protein HRG_07685 [Hirsutella rhossiliensis]KAH0961607.1 hypothetical protein HRG_07685 [Hirsutella rhossiliensis]